MKKYFYILSFFIALLLAFAEKGLGQIAAWDCTGGGSYVTLAATTFNANLSSSNLITRGAGAAASAGANSFRTVGFKNDGIATANTDYFQTTIGAAAGYKVSLSTIDATFAGTATYCAAPGVSGQFAYSLDGGTTKTLIGSAFVLTGTPVTMTQINVSGIPVLQNVNSGTTITLYFYASGQTATGGWGFYSSGAGVNGLAIGGTVAANCPTYAAIPYFQSFEAWVNDCSGGVARVPDTHWAASIGGAGNNVDDWWHRNDLTTGDWALLTNATGAYAPTFSQGAFSARFRNNYSTAGTTGALDLYVDLSQAGNKTISFDYIHAELSIAPFNFQVLLSTDGGVTFPTTLLTIAGNVASWTTQTITTALGTSTSVIRFIATDKGGKDVGIDNLSVSACSPAYAALPYTQDFEAWVNDPCSGGVARVPDTHWESSVAAGGTAYDYWHIDNYGNTGDWTGLATGTGAYAPAFSRTAHSARFRNLSSTGGTQGILDLYVDLSSPGTKNISFDYSHNETWTSNFAFDVLLSTDGGATFPTSLLHIANGTGALTFGGAGSTQTFSTSVVSSTSVIRFKVTDKGSVDVGIDNLSISVSSCAAAAPPYSENFDGTTVPALPACWLALDVDADGNTWQTNNSSSIFPPPSGGSSPNAMFCEYNCCAPNNDWAFSKGISLTAGVTYTVSFVYAAYSSSYTEKLVLAYGTAQTSAGMITIYTNAGFSNTAYATATATFTPGATNTYYLGFHDYSVMNQYGIFVDNINLTAPVGGHTITTSAIAPTTYCAGATVSVPYTITGVYAGNVFTAQLSDATGSFGSPTAIGTLTSNIAGTITATIPIGTVSGTLYRIRVVSSAPAVIGSDNGANITINPVPLAAGIISGPASVCQGQNGVAYSVSIIPNATSYVWAYSGAGGTIVGTTNAITIDFSGVATSGNLTVYATNACGNGTTSANYPITVNPMPVITAQPGNQSVGIGNNATFTVATSTGGSTFQWQMSPDNLTWVNVANGTPAGVTYTNPTTATLTANGTSPVVLYYYRCVITAGGCSVNSNSATLTITNGCLTGIVPPWTENFDAMGSVGMDIFPPCWSYQTLSGNDPGTDNNVDIYEGPRSAPNYLYTQYSSTAWVFTPLFSLTAGQSYSFSFWMMNKDVTSPVDFLMNVAYGTTQTSGGMTHVLASNVNCNNAAWQQFSYTFSPAATGTYYFGIKSTSTTYTPWYLSFDDFAVTTSCAPPTITLGASPAVCRGITAASLPYSATTNAPNQYSITYDATALGAGFVNVALTALPASPIPITVPAAAAASTYNATVTVKNTVSGCSSSATAFTVTVNPFPSASGGITGVTPVCQGQNGVVYSVGAIVNATGYTWTYTGAGFSIASGGGTNSITANFSAAATAGTLTVTGTNACGSGTTSANYPIAVNPLPAASGVIAGTPNPCNGSSGIAYSVGAIANAASYTWTYTGTGFSIATGSGSNAITANFSGTATSGNLTVYGVDACGNGTVSANYVITIGAVTTPNAGSDQYICASPATMAANAIAGASWTKISGGAATITTAALATTTITGLVSGTYVFRWTNSCGSYDDVVIVVQ